MTTDTNALPTAPARRGAILVALLTGQMMASIDGSIVSVAAPTIRSGLHASDAQIQLVLSGYLLTTGVLFVTCARIGDVVGHRRCFLAGLMWFTVASLVCGFSGDAAMLVTARIAQALGAALLMPQVFALIHRLWRGQERRRAIGLYGMVLALGVALGQVVGGLVVGIDLLGLSWRPAFLINGPIGVLALALGVRHLPPSGSDRSVRLDPIGVALLTVAMVLIMLPLVFGPELGWSLATWLVLVAGLILLGLFLAHEARARHPVLDLDALRPPQVRWGLLSCCLVMGCYTVFLLTLTLHLQAHLGFTPLQAGLAFVPYALGFGALNLTWHSRPRWLRHLLPVIGPLLCAASLLAMVALDRDEWAAARSVPLLLLAGAGHAAGYSPLISLVTAKLDPALASAVSALNSTGPVLAEVVAVAGLGALYFAADRSSDGLLHVAGAVALLLCVAAGCATMALRAVRLSGGKGLLVRRDAHGRSDRR